MYNFFPHLGGYLDLAEKRRRLIHFHFVEMDIMEMLAGWSESMVYIPVRAGVGEHIWEQALHVDQMAWALRNLKANRRWLGSQSPSDEFIHLLEKIWQTADPLLRLVGVYRVLKPHLIAAYQAYIDGTDHLADQFSVRVLLACITDHQRHITWGNTMIAHLATQAPARHQEALQWQHTLESELVQVGGILSEGESTLHLPFAGWPETAAATASTGDDQGPPPSKGYTYRKGFTNQGSVELAWDSRFRYATTPDDLPHPPPRTPEALVVTLHGLFHGECQTVDRMGWILVDFPELPWELRKDIAQQAWEEARHIMIVAQLTEGLGGHLGQYPFPPYWGRLRRDHHHPVAHLVIGNIIGEAGASALTYDALEYSQGWGNDWLRRGLEHLGADEVVHIGFGRKWARHLIHTDREAYGAAGLAKAKTMVDIMDSARVAKGFPTSTPADWQQVEQVFARLGEENSEA
ncbi:MAG: ferritin-like domain-containing protein [Chloroflexi bacterium]|nr:ferritin-like domain-containing protein [Chloroflexota bacterium]